MTKNDNPLQFSIDLLANFVGRGWAALVSLAVVPVYLNYLGIEAYGLVGVQVSLTALLSLLDFGMSAAVSREFAAMAAQPGTRAQQRDLLRTLEPLYWAMALFAGGVVALLAGPIAQYWVNPGTLPVATVREAILLIGLAIAAQWSVALYSGGLTGLERQVSQNTLAVCMTTVRALGAIAVLAWISPTIQAFFFWQALCSGLHAVLGSVLLWKQLPQDSAPAHFRPAMLLKFLPTALGMAGIVASSAILTQIDKLILSNLLSLKEFGYYTLAATAASVLFHVVTPVFTAVFPRLSRLLAQGKRGELTLIYSQASQVMAVTVLPVAATLGFFSSTILRLWTGDQTIVSAAALPLTLLAAGNAANALINPPYTLCLASGSLRPVLIMNVIATLLMTPLVWFLIGVYGTAGGAGAWLVVNVLYLVVGVPAMHTGLLDTSTVRWFVRDILLPLVAATLIAGLGRLIVPSGLSWTGQLASVVLTGMAAFVAAVTVSNTSRSMVLRVVASRSH